MIKSSTVFLIIAIIAILQLFPGFAIEGNAVSVVPGWHTTIFPPYTIVIFAQLLWICLLPLLYWFIQRKKIMLPTWVVPLHLACTLCYFISPGIASTLFTVESSFLWMVAPLLAFVLGQVIFLFSLLANLKVRAHH